MDTIKVEALVQEFLAAQSLKVLPQAPFGDAVNQFVSKDDKHAMEVFVEDSLADQVKNLLSLEADEDELDSAMERVRSQLESQFAAGRLKLTRKRMFKPKPDEWDSDLDGHWEDQPQARLDGQDPEAPPDITNGRARGRVSRTVHDDDDEEQDEDMFMDDGEEEEPAPRAPARRGAAARTTKAAPAKKAPTAKKPPARNSRKKAVVEEDDEDEDMFVDQDDDFEESAPPPKPAPRRAAPARATRTTRTPATKQTKLNFSQSQRAAPKSTQKTLDISDDQISDDDEFETMPSTRSRRR